MNVGAHLGKFSSDHSSLMCEVIAHWLTSTAESNGRINWQDVCAILNSKLSKKEGADATIYSEIDCHKHWRLLAYGEQHVDDDSQVDGMKVFQHNEDSDEESFYVYPMQAIARRVPRRKHAFMPTSVQNTAPEMGSKITYETVDDSIPNRNSEEVKIIQSSEIDSGTNSSSSSSSQSKPTLCSSVGSTIVSSEGSSGPLLRKPEQHNSRNTKMFVSSQIHSGELSMKHILFTFSKDPFEKISNNNPTGLCLSSIGDNLSFLSSKRLISKTIQQAVPMSRMHQQTSARPVTAQQAPTSSSHAAFERSRQTQSISPRQPPMGSTPSSNSSSATATVSGLSGHSSGASQYHDLTEDRYDPHDSNTHRNTTSSSNSHMNGLSLQEREIRYGNTANGASSLRVEQLGSSSRQTEHEYALQQQQQQQRHQYALQQQHYQKQLLQQQQLQQQQQQLQQQQLQQYEQNKQQSQQYQHQQSNYWNSVMERTNGSSHPAHPVMTRDEVAYQYRNVSSGQNNRNYGAHTDSGNSHQTEGGPSFEQIDGAASSSARNGASSIADHNRPVLHSNELSAAHQDYTYHQHAYIPNGNSSQMGSANGHCPSPQSKNSGSNNNSSEKKRKREKLHYVNFVQKSAQTDYKRLKAASDGSFDHYQDHPNGQRNMCGQDQRSRSGSLKDDCKIAPVKVSTHSTNEHRQSHDSTSATPLLSSSQSHVSVATHHSVAMTSDHRHSDHSSSVVLGSNSSSSSCSSSSSHTDLGSRPQSSSAPQSDNGLAVLLLAISGTPPQSSTSSLSLPALDLNSFASNMDKHFPLNHNDHNASCTHQSHTSGDGAVKLMNSPPQLLDPL